MRRRKFITFLSGAAAAPLLRPLAARAQQPERMRRLGVLTTRTDSAESEARYAAFLQTLQGLGWTLGRNLQIDVRRSAPSPQSAQTAATELLGLAPDVILAASSINADAMRKATRTVPIVFVNASDPLSSGLVKSLAHPGGNLTGFSNFEFSIGGKWLETLKEIAPGIKRVLVLHVPSNIGNQGLLRALVAAGSSLDVRPVPAPALDAAMIEHAIDAFAQEPNGGLVALPGPQVLTNRDRIAGLAARHRLPAIYPYRSFIASGGLMSYDTNMEDIHRLAAAYVDRILRGEKPGDLPVQQPTKFEFVINLKAAKALGLTVPLALLARADEVIE